MYFGVGSLCPRNPTHEPHLDRPVNSGKFITLEGGDGTGKSTQVDRLVKSLCAYQLEALATREPGGSPGAEEIRKLVVFGETARWDAITELLLHYAARRDHVTNTIRPALARGQWMVCDRFMDSTMAYQGYGHALGYEIVSKLRQIVINDFSPDLTLILDLPIEIGLARAHASGRIGRYERMDNNFHQRLRDGYLEIARQEPKRCVVIDASRNSNDVHNDILSTVRTRFGI